MTLYLWFVFFFAVQVIHFLGTWKLYQAAGRKSWEAAVPVYNSIVLMKIIQPSNMVDIITFHSYYKPDYVSCCLGRNLKNFWKKIDFRYFSRNFFAWFLYLLRKLHSKIRIQR